VTTVPLARSERAALAALLDAVGPDAPTLCSGWTARDLAAHLVLREGRPDAAVGILGGPLAGYTASVQQKIASRPWGELVEAVRTGPPRWSPMAIERLDVEANTIEYFVHHEDVRRAADDWEPRDLPAEAVDQLWSRVRGLSKLLLRKCPVGVVVEPTDGSTEGTRVRLRDGEPGVALVGPVGEIVLALFGRETSGLDLRGPDDQVVAFLAFPR